MKLSMILLLALLAIVASAGKPSGFRVLDDESTDDDLDGGKPKPGASFRVSTGKDKKNPGAAFRVNTGEDKQKPGAAFRVNTGKDKKNPGAAFRVAGGSDAECPTEMFQLVSAMFPKLCLDGSKKRLSLKPCGKATAHNMFSVHRAGKSFLLNNKGECLSSSSLTKGPCETNMVSLSRNGAFHMVKMSNNKCLTTKNKKSLNMVKCGPKNKKQHFRFVPIFDAAPAAPAVGDGFRMTGNKKGGDKKGGDASTGFRMTGKKGGDKGGDASTGFRLTEDDGSDDIDGGKKNKKMGFKKGKEGSMDASSDDN